MRRVIITFLGFFLLIVTMSRCTCISIIGQAEQSERASDSGRYRDARVQQEGNDFDILQEQRNRDENKRIDEESEQKVEALREQQGIENIPENMLREPIILKHTWFVSGVSFSKDGKSLLTSSFDYSVVLWDTRTGAKIRSFGPGLTLHYKKKCRAINDCYPDYNELCMNDACYAQDNKKGHIESVQFASFINNDTQIISTSNDRTAMLWETKTGKRIQQYGPGGVRTSTPCELLSPYQKEECSPNQFCYQGYCYDTDRKLGHKDAIFIATELNSGLATASVDTTIQLWNKSTGLVTHTILGSGKQTGTLCDSDKSCEQGQECIQNFCWNVDYSKGHAGPINFLYTLKDNALISACSRTIIKWNMTTNKVLQWKVVGTMFGIPTVNENKGIILIPKKRSLDVYRLSDFTEVEPKIQTSIDQYDFWGATLSPDGKYIAAIYDMDNVQIFDFATRQLIKTIPSGLEPEKPNSQICTVESNQFCREGFQCNRGVCLKINRMIGHTSTISTMNFSHNSKFLVTGDVEGYVRIVQLFN